VRSLKPANLLGSEIAAVFRINDYWRQRKVLAMVEFLFWKQLRNKTME
jgi:hypothetical protein